MGLGAGEPCVHRPSEGAPESRGAEGLKSPKPVGLVMTSQILVVGSGQ